MPTIIELGQKVKQKYPGQYDDLSDIEVGQKVKQKFPGSYDDYEDVSNTFKYETQPVQLTPEQRQSRLIQAQQEAEQYAKEAKKAKSFGGLVKNTIKGVGATLASSQIGLGETIGKAKSSKFLDTYTNNINQLTNTQIQLQKQINERDKQGLNTENLKRAFNDIQDQIEQNQAEITKYGGELPSTGKVLGQLGGTALDVLTAGTYGKSAQGMKTAGLSKSSLPFTKKVATSAGMPELGKVVGQKTSGLFTKKGLSNIGVGAGVGYASDVTQGLQGARGEDRAGGKAFRPGVGTVLGITIPTLMEGSQTIKNLRDPELKAQRLIAKRQSGLEKLDKYQSIKKATEKGKERGIDIKKILSETDVLSGAVDNTGTITTKGDGGAVEQYTRQFIDGNENIVSDLLKKENRSVSPDYIKARLIQKVKKAGIEGKNLTNALKSIDDEVAGYMLRADSNGNIPVSIIHDAKIDKYNGINFFTEGATKKYDKTIAQGLKEMVEESTTSADIKTINQELSKHFAVIDYLNRLDNKKVDGGKLGKYFSQTVGAIVGSNFGPLGSIVGAEAGGAIKGGLMSRAFNGKTGKIPQQSEVITEALRVKNEPALRLPQSKSNNLGSRQISQTPTITPTKNVISDTIPQETYLEQGKRELRQIKDVITKDQKGFIAIPSGKKELPKAEAGLINEAKKYKTAEEFVKARTELTYKNLQENDYSIKQLGKNFDEPVEYFRAGNIRKKGDIWLTDNEAGAIQYSKAGGGTKIGSYVVESKNPLIIDTAGGKYANGNIDINKILTKEEIAQGYTNNPTIKQKFIDYAKKNGYDAVQFADSFPDGEGGMTSLVVWDKSKIKTKSQLTDIWNKANKK